MERPIHRRVPAPSAAQIVYEVLAEQDRSGDYWREWRELPEAEQRAFEAAASLKIRRWLSQRTDDEKEQR